MWFDTPRNDNTPLTGLKVLELALDRPSPFLGEDNPEGES